MRTPSVERSPLRAEDYLGKQRRIGKVMLTDPFERQEPPVANGETEQQIEYISFDDLEKRYLANRNLEAEQQKCHRIIFRRGGEEITDLTGYNTTQPILAERYDPDSRQPYFILGVRMEERSDEVNSKVVLFRADSAFSTHWDMIEDEDEEVPEIMGQDPSATEIDGELLLGVVEVEKVPDSSEDGSHLEWWQMFYKGPNIRGLKPLGRGPKGMKNITPIEMPTGEIVVFTRPQNPGNEELGGLGQIGVKTISSIEEIKNEKLLKVENAALINTRALPGKEWLGIKYGIALIDGRIGVIGHIACYDTDSPLYDEKADKKPKKYATISGKYNLLTGIIEDIKIEAMADEFVGVIPKTKYLAGVDYATALTPSDENGKVMLIQGVGDAETWSKEIDDPFAGLRLPEQRYQLAA